jgi:hypothetical protein
MDNDHTRPIACRELTYRVAIAVEVAIDNGSRIRDAIGTRSASMKPAKLIGVGVAILALGTSAAFCQQMISARAGMVHYVEGKVFAGTEQLDGKFGNFPQIKENQVLRTEEGRAEVLLTPGVFLRAGENSSFRMITNRLIDTRLEFLTGSIIVESDDMLKDNSVTIVAKDATVHLRKSGVYRFDSEPAELRVFKGAVDVEAGGKTFELKEGKALGLTSELAIAKFDTKDSDALSRWSYRRAEYVSMANVSAAKTLSDGGGYTGYGSGLYNAGYGIGNPCINPRSSLWAFNPYFGMYTYIPCSGRYSSPYGFLFWSPLTVYQVYAARPVYQSGWGRDAGFGANRGYTGLSQASGGYSGAARSVSSGSVSAGSPGPSAGAAPSASSGVSHSGGGGGGHR